MRPAIFTTVTLPDWLVVFGALFPVVCLVVALRTLEALTKLRPKNDFGDSVESLNRLAKETKDLLVLADRTNGIKAAVFGFIGVLVGAVGGLSADWVAHGTWSSAATPRAAGVLGGLAILTAIAFYFVARFRLSPGLKAGSNQPSTDSTPRPKARGPDETVRRGLE